MITIPNHLKDAHYPGAKKLEHGKGYQYAHDYENHYVEQQYLPDELVGHCFYRFSNQGKEKEMKEYLERIRKK